MNNDSTGAPRLGSALDALALLHQYAVHFPELPAPYIALHPSVQPLIDLQVRVDCFEPWREALDLDPNTVSLYPVGRTSSNIGISGIASIGVDDRVVEVPVHLYACGLPHLEERKVQHARQIEDPHDSPLHQIYALPHDLPTRADLPENLR